MDSLKELLSVNTVSGSELSGSNKVYEIFSNSGAEVTLDKLSNVIATKNKKGKFKVLLDAHFDTIGLMVTKILKGGFIKFTALGGVDPRILPSLTVTVHGSKDITGVIGVVPPHLLKGDDKSAYKIEDLFIDTGKDEDELKKIVSVGDVISFKSEYTELLNGRIASAGLDDKIGVYIVSEVLSKMDNENICLFGVATIGEEIGLKGAKVISNFDDFDLAIIIDVTHGMTPDAIKNRAFELGKGPVITLGPSLSKEYNDKIKKVANKKNIDIQIEVEPGNTGTNAWVYHSLKTSCPSVMVSVPLRYMHTSYEVCDKGDILSSVDLILEFLNSIGGEV